MKKIIIGGLVVILLAVAFVLINKNSPLHEKEGPITTNSESAGNSNDSEAVTTDEDAPAVRAGQYIDYSDTVIGVTPGTKLLFFHAPWCPQCRELEASIQKGPIPANISIIKVDYDSNQALREKYGVTLQTTIVRVDDSGTLIDKQVAYDEPTLEAIIRNLP